MASPHEGPEHSKHQSDDRIENARSIVFELAETVATLRNRAGEMGLFQDRVFYSAHVDSSEILRVAAQPIELTNCNPPEPYLRINVNRVIAPPAGTTEPRLIFSEEYVIGSASLTRQSAYYVLSRNDKLKAKEQVPIIWQNTLDEWHVFRGSQNYFVPQLPHVDQDSEVLASQLAEAQDLSRLLQQLSPACEDGRYPM